MVMNLDAGAHPGPMGALKPPRVAPPAYLRPRARRWSGGAAHSNLVHVAGWLVVALLLLAFGLSVLAACLPLWLVACCLVIALLLATFGHSVWVVCQSPGLHTFTLVLGTAAATGDERTPRSFLPGLIPACSPWLLGL